uniref:Uncharacterized protein n=1 Tax=Melanopsichium pennsylvanicum 4 TaxID=1398559 RepID=A0A077QZ77_9BASI|nr:uncharacterized protein BN887_06286 [Melanopsichium pennsylvanicum 4]
MWNRTPASSGGNSIISTPQSNTCSSSSSTFTHSSKDSTPHTRAKTDLGDDTRQDAFTVTATATGDTLRTSWSSDRRTPGSAPGRYF